MGTHTTRPLLFLLVMIITMQFLFCGIYYPNRENYVVKINYGDNVNKGDPDVVSKERGYLLQTLGDKEVHDWLYAINPLLAGQIRLAAAVPMKVDETVRVNTSEHHTVKNIIKRQLKCPEIPSGLGLSHVKLFHLHPIMIEYSNVKKGGISKSYGCKPQQKAAVIIAVESGWSKTALNTFLYYLHTFLRKQQLDYQMFVVEKGNSSQGFSRGKLLNAAFTEIHRRNATIRFPCIIFHDPHILPLDTRNLYRCTWNPKQLAVEIMTNDRKIYKPTFGGAVALTFEQFITVNGFSSDSWNNFEFHGIYKRLISRNYTIERSPELFGKYVIPKIFDQHGIPFESVNASTVSTEMEGLANLIYDVVKFEIRNMYTFLQIDFPDDSKETAVTFTAPWDEMTSIKEIPAEFESLSNYTFSRYDDHRP